MILVWITAALIATAVGLWLILAGYRQQQHLQCARCGYDLSGSIDSDRCPECGAVLDASNVRSPGESTTVWWRIALGAAILLLSLLAVWALVLVWVIRL